ncbi:NADH-quinone oxidoreductase subunit C [uncultured Desulfovibrio sp.]|uniref:NADH-quinone oxidoreductase subunit C n=1 Tax=uncultured Desulfovibrio sp. TaxID=167968 RepID=UPI0025E51ADA|nr:NADH-quinone oxidoreductase subunit C [uncultured Desulfovibrio sp.]
MHDIIRGNTTVIEGIEPLCAHGGSVRHTSDSFGNAYHWFQLDTPHQLLQAAEILHSQGARLAMISAYNRHAEGERMQALCYHFVLEGIGYNLTVLLDAEWPEVPSITPLFANADWHEREMMELYGIRIINHPNPRRLFLDEELDKGLLGEMVPLSIMMNGASSTDLWERILQSKESRS